MTTAAHAAALAATIDVAGAGPVRFSSPIDVTQPVQFSRPTMVMDDEPEAPRQRRVGAGWVGARTQGGGGGGGGEQPQPQSRPETPGPISAVVGPNGQITLTWEDLSTNETGFAVDHQMLIDATWETSGTFTAGPGREQLIVTVPMGEHRFRVAAYNPGGMSTPTDWGAAVQTTDPVDVALIPLMPANVLAERIAAETVRVSWDDASANETSFEVERDPPFSDGTRTVAANVTAYEDSGADGDFRYRVRSVNEHGESGWAGWVDISETDLPPEAPGSFAANDAGNGNTIRLTWVDNSSNETSFAIERQQQVGGQWGTTTELEAAANGTEFLDPAGTGTFRYRVAARNDAGSSPWSVWATATVTAAGGWTEFTRSSDTRVVYVSSSEGNDSNDGLSEDRPKRTIAAGYAVLRNRYPDWLLLKRGDTWTHESFGPAFGAPWERSGRSETEMMVIGAYGNSPARPVLRIGGGIGIQLMGGDATRDHLAITGIEFYAHTRDPNSPDFIDGPTGSEAGAYGVRRYKDGTNFLIEDCMFRFCQTGIAIQTGGTEGIHNVRLRRNIIVDSYGKGAHSQGVYIVHVNGFLMEDCVLDHCGWNEQVEGAESTVFNHGIYVVENLNQNVVMRNNISARQSATGLQCRTGGEVSGNLLLLNPTSISMGHAQIRWPEVQPSGSITGNVILGAADIQVGGVRGRGIQLARVSGVLVSDNVVAHMNGTTSGPGVGIRTEMEHEDVTIENNIVYKWDYEGSGQSIGLTGSLGRRIVVRDNWLQQLDGGEMVAQSVVGFAQHSYARNHYYSSDPGSTWFRTGSMRISLSDWLEAAGEQGATNYQHEFSDPERSIATYMNSIGRTGDVAEFLHEARRQTRLNWRPAFTAQAVNAYIRDGFDLPPR